MALLKELHYVIDILRRPLFDQIRTALLGQRSDDHGSTRLTADLLRALATAFGLIDRHTSLNHAL